MRGRPLGFVGLVLTGWVAARTALLWPEAERVAQAIAERRPTQTMRRVAATADPTVRFVSQVAGPAFQVRPVAGPRGARSLNDAQIVALFGPRYYYETRPDAATPVSGPGVALFEPVRSPPGDAAGAAVISAAVAPSRWTLAGWLVARPGRTDPRLGPLLGSSQAGARLSYALDEERRFALFTRVAAPLSHGANDVAVGAQWRPTRAPVTVFAEARHRAGAGVAPAAGLFGGGGMALPAGFRLETYGQAGWVGGEDATGFAEGQARAARSAKLSDVTRLDVGIGIWGAAQRGAARLDVGPGLGIDVPLAGGRVRLGVDWRQRVAGRAAPGSGPALTLGAGF